MIDNDKINTTFCCSLADLSIENVGILASTFALGFQQHGENSIFKIVALGFIAELEARVKKQPPPGLVIDFAAVSLAEIRQAIVASVILGINVTNLPAAYPIIEGIGEALQQEWLRRTKPAAPAALTTADRIIN